MVQSILHYQPKCIAGHRSALPRVFLAYLWAPMRQRAAILALLTACEGYAARAPTPEASWQAQLAAWHHPDPLPNFAFTNARGQSVHVHDWSEMWVLAAFIYTQCPQATACPLTTAKMKRLQALAREQQVPLQLVSFTLDPQRDTPDALLDYATRQGLDLGNWELVTGPEKLMREGLPSLFNVLALPSSGGTIDHVVKVALLRPGLTLHREWKDNAFEPQDVLAAMRSQEGN